MRRKALKFFGLLLMGLPLLRGGDIVSMVDTIYGLTDAFYVGSDFHIHALYYDGAWHHVDLTAITGAPLSADGMIRPVLDTLSGTLDVFYQGKDNYHLYQLYYNGGAWQYVDVTMTSFAPPPAPFTEFAPLVETNNGRPDVFFLGWGDRHLYQLYFDTGAAWRYSDVTAAAGAPPPAFMSSVTAFLDTIRGTPDVFYNGRFEIDSDQHLLYFDGNWHHVDASVAAGAPWGFTSEISGLLDTVNGTPDLFYVDEEVQAMSLLYFNGSWNYVNVTLAAGAPKAVSNQSAILDTVNGTPDVFYLAQDSDLHVLYYTGSWHDVDVTVASGSPAAYSALAAVMDTINGTPDLFYIGTDKHVHLIYYNGTWNAVDVTSAAGAPPV